MLISSAWAHGAKTAGSSGGANALLIILGVGILFALIYTGRKRWLERKARHDDNDETQIT